MAKSKRTFITLEVNDDFKQKLKTRARDRQMTLSPFIKNILSQYLIDNPQ